MKAVQLLAVQQAAEECVSYFLIAKSPSFCVQSLPWFTERASEPHSPACQMLIDTNSVERCVGLWSRIHDIPVPNRRLWRLSVPEYPSLLLPASTRYLKPWRVVQALQTFSG